MHLSCSGRGDSGNVLIVVVEYDDHSNGDSSEDSQLGIVVEVCSDCYVCCHDGFSQSSSSVLFASQRIPLRTGVDMIRTNTDCTVENFTIIFVPLKSPLS